MTDEKTLVVAEELLPIIQYQSKQIDEMKNMIKELQENKIAEHQQDMEVMPLDFRKIDAFLAIQQAYYGIFERNRVALENVPLRIIQKADKWALKMFNKDLKKQVNKNYAKTISKEKEEIRSMKFKKFMKSLIKPFKWFIGLFKKKKVENTSTQQPRQAD